VTTPDWLARYAEAMYLLARFCPPGPAGWRAGRGWERSALAAFKAAGASVCQGPGNLTLFGRGSTSGVSHEIDGAGAGRGWTLMHEAKAYSGRGPSKEELFCFDRKTFDLFVERRRAGEEGLHWRALVSAGPIDDDLRRYCYLYGVIAVDPVLVPLPVLLRMVAKPEADLFFEDKVLGELVRLGEGACGPIEARYTPEGRNRLSLDLRGLMTKGDLDDLLWLQREVTTDLLDFLDREGSTYFEERADEVAARCGLAGGGGLKRPAA
jgi:hypothetical protein